jgi:NADH-quinone oxidoreductase subunit A
MESHLLPILIFMGGAAALAVGLLVVGGLLGPRRNSAAKEMPYESGMDPIHDARRRFDVRFHLVAIAFLIFDVELLFLYPWAVASRQAEGIDAAVGDAQRMSAAVGLGDGFQIGFSRGLVFVEVMVFIGLLTVGLIYAWRKGVLQWR